MATNWAKLSFFNDTDLEILPELFGGLPRATAKVNFHKEVKRFIERVIKDVYMNVGRSTSDTADDFNIDEIVNGEILAESALDYNYVLIAKFYAKDISSLDDEYGVYYNTFRDDVEKNLAMDINQLKFNNPVGINQLTSFSQRVTR